IDWVRMPSRPATSARPGKRPCSTSTSTAASTTCSRSSPTLAATCRTVSDCGLMSTDLLDLADDSPEALLSLYESRGWGDGLPMVPPTTERVAAALAALGDVDPDEVIATLPPRFGEATRRVIAINAVL